MLPEPRMLSPSLTVNPTFVTPPEQGPALADAAGATATINAETKVSAPIKVIAFRLSIITSLLPVSPTFRTTRDEERWGQLPQEAPVTSWSMEAVVVTRHHVERCPVRVLVVDQACLLMCLVAVRQDTVVIPALVRSVM
jgi:hypothetical protein